MWASKTPQLCAFLASTPRILNAEIVLSQSIRYTSSRNTVKKKRKRQGGENVPDKHDDPPNLSYIQILANHKEEARRSILIQHPKKLAALHDYCEQYGAIANIFAYNREEKEYALVEFAHHDAISRLLGHTSHFPNSQRIAVNTRFLFFPRYNQRGTGRISTSNSMVNNYGLVCRPTEKPFNQGDLVEHISKLNSLSAQIKYVHHSMKMTELKRRLRFFIATAVEEVLQGLFPRSIITPFGSSVNGFGKNDSDLDLVFEIEDEKYQEQDQLNRNGMYFMSKMKHEEERLFHQDSLDAIGHFLKIFIPQCSHVRRILRARVPIVKFQHSGSDTECDLCVSNRSALFMSELLYTFGEFDTRVRPLVFMIRHWARVNGVNHSNPGPWISSFTLGLLVIYYLQRRPIPVLPNFGKMKELAGPDDRKVIDGVDVSFLTNWRKLKVSGNTESLAELLQGFFDFYGEFDFREGISCIRGTTFPKPEDSAMFLENPLEPNMNVSKNVMESEINDFQTCCQESFRVLESNMKPIKKGPWGIAKIIETKNSGPSTFNITMHGLFETGMGSDRSESSCNSRLSDHIKSEIAELESVEQGAPQREIDLDVAFNPNVNSSSSAGDSSNTTDTGNNSTKAVSTKFARSS